MLIRSQDKEDIVNLDTLSIISAVEKDDGTVKIGVGEISGQPMAYAIGEYSSMEKAKKVLDMILDNYSACLYHHGSLNSYDTDDGVKWVPIPEFAFVPPSVFQMPLDSEVAVGSEAE